MIVAGQAGKVDGQAGVQADRWLPFRGTGGRAGMQKQQYGMPCAGVYAGSLVSRHLVRCSHKF